MCEHVGTYQNKFFSPEMNRKCNTKGVVTSESNPTQYSNKLLMAYQMRDLEFISYM